MRVLVLDGNENHAVAAVRSLACAGHRVVVGASTSWSKAGWSRDAACTFVYPAPQADALAFVRCVADEAAREPGTLVLPMTERTTLPLSLHRDLIDAARARMVLPSHATVVRAFDKQETTQLARALGVSVPQTVVITCTNEARRTAAELPYPVVLKARSSEEVTVSGTVRATGAPLYARNAEEFIKAYEAMSRRCSAVLVQEFIEGTGAGYFALMHHGELRMEFAHRRIRDVRPTGSGSALRESVRPDARVKKAALAILCALGWHGVAMVEFRQKPDGTPVFMEVNARFWNSLALSVYAGADFPARLAEMAERGDVEPNLDYRVGVRCRWLLGDFRHFVEVLRGAPAGYPGAFPSRLGTLLKICIPRRGTLHDNLTRRDPLPELGDWLDFFARRLPAGLKPRAVKRETQSDSQAAASQSVI
ncbi:MAG TPA: acetate--CoA ligase family protein [Blastocatellia bacterium]|nr:acetate--CoA ligase family protein [Blastocatellia bacterium]